MVETQIFQQIEMQLKSTIVYRIDNTQKSRIQLRGKKIQIQKRVNSRTK